MRQGAERAEISAEFDLGRRPAAAALARGERSRGRRGRLPGAARDQTRRALARLHQRPARDARAAARAGRAPRRHPRPARAPVARARRRRSASCSTPTAGSRTRPAKVAELYRAWQRAPRRRASLPRRTRRPIAAERERARVAGAGARVPQPRGGRVAGADRPSTRRLAHAASLIEARSSGCEALSEGESVQPRAGERGHRQADGAASSTIRGCATSSTCSSRRASSCRKRCTACGTTSDRLELDPQRLREVERRLDAVHARGAQVSRRRPRSCRRSSPPRRRAWTSWARAATPEALRALEERGAARRAWRKRRSCRRARKKAAKKLSDAGDGGDAGRSRWRAGASRWRCLRRRRSRRYGLEQVEFLVAAHKGMDAAAAREGRVGRRALAPVASRSRP